MNRQQALDLVSSLPGRELSRLFSLGRPLSGLELRPGLYRGRNGGGPAAAKWVARNIVKRDWFAKLVLDGYGVNVRCLQDARHRLRPQPAIAGGVVVDLPFRLTAAGLDYGWHVLGHDLPGLLQFRDLLAAIELRALRDAVANEHLLRVGACRGEDCEDAELIIGLMAPLGLGWPRGVPFGMIWDHEPTPAEVESCRAYVRRCRLFDTGCGQRP
jgi:hypothetical protein